MDNAALFVKLLSRLKKWENEASFKLNNIILRKFSTYFSNEPFPLGSVLVKFVKGSHQSSFDATWISKPFEPPPETTDASEF